MCPIRTTLRTDCILGKCEECLELFDLNTSSGIITNCFSRLICFCFYSSARSNSHFFCWKKIYICTTYIKKSAMLATTTDLWKIKQMWHELWLLAEIIDIQCRMNNNEFIVFKVCLSYTYDRCNEVCTNYLIIIMISL